VDQQGLGLRAGDALHLAVAAEHGATLWTLDVRLAEAGPVLGVATGVVGDGCVIRILAPKSPLSPKILCPAHAAPA
jgi:hypothetical protein